MTIILLCGCEIFHSRKSRGVGTDSRTGARRGLAGMRLDLVRTFAGTPLGCAFFLQKGGAGLSEITCAGAGGAEASSFRRCVGCTFGCMVLPCLVKLAAKFAAAEARCEGEIFTGDRLLV